MSTYCFTKEFDDTEKAIPDAREHLTMSTSYEFSNEAIQNFCNQHGITINLTAEQNERLTDFGKTPLLVDQISNVVNQLCPDEESLKKFIEQRSTEFDPIAVSLYVLNDDLWKIMSRKHEHPEKMLPMTTIPWFYWEKDEEGRKNPLGVKKTINPKHPLITKLDKGVLKLSGKGGDFAGLLEGRIVDPYTGIRPIFIPGSAGPKKPVAKYDSQMVQVKINIHSSKTKLYPIPMKELDYIYSENPRVFYDHGIQIEIDGGDVNLKVGKRRETTLRGKVIVFIGKDFEEMPNSDQMLMFHAWLAALNKAPFL